MKPDNWQAEEKINELVDRYNRLAVAVEKLLIEIDAAHRVLGQSNISTVTARKMLGGLIRPLDLSPQTTEPYKPKLIVRDDKTS